jgi:hypothetical protein
MQPFWVKLVCLIAELHCSGSLWRQLQLCSTAAVSQPSRSSMRIGQEKSDQHIVEYSNI